MSSPSLDRLKRIQPANPNTIQDKFLVGYQGWFTCSGDGEPIGPGHHGWLHWLSDPLPAGGRPNTDLWPDTTAYAPDELYTIEGLTMPDGTPAQVFSSRNGKTVHRHFRWMAEHSVDGAFLQRFVGQCDVLDGRGNEGIRRIRDEVGMRVREAAEREERAWAIMYDVTGVPADRVQKVIEHDWMHLIHTQRVLDSPMYLKEKGRPVISLWGFGFSDRDYTPATITSIARFFREHTPGGCYLIAGVPAHWRTCCADASSDPVFVGLFLNEFDAISPWTIGRYNDEESADRFAEEKIRGDLELIRQRNQAAEMAGSHKRVDYIPVIHPGGSGHNLSEGKWNFNDAKRNGGKYLWRQIWNAKRQGVRTMYGAMWDEYDEGTAFLPVVPSKRQLPRSSRWQFLALDAEGHDLPSDWYMRICGFAVEGLRSERMIHETFPVKELQDYWSSRPHYATDTTPSSSNSTAAGTSSSTTASSGASAGQGYQDWLASQGQAGDGEEPPPPPYTLEADEQQPAAAESVVSTAGPQTLPAPSQTGELPPQRPNPAMGTRPVAPSPTMSTRPIALTPPTLSYPGLSTAPDVLSSSYPGMATPLVSSTNATSYSGTTTFSSAPTAQMSSYPGMVSPQPSLSHRPTPTPHSTLGPQTHTSSYLGMAPSSSPPPIAPHRQGSGSSYPGMNTSSSQNAYPNTSLYSSMTPPAASSTAMSTSAYPGMLSGHLEDNFGSMNIYDNTPNQTSPKPSQNPSWHQVPAAPTPGPTYGVNADGHVQGASISHVPTHQSSTSYIPHLAPSSVPSFSPASAGPHGVPHPGINMSHVSPVHTGGSAGSSSSGGAWSQAQWPPTDWQAAGMTGGANLGRTSSAQASLSGNQLSSVQTPGLGLGRTSSASGAGVGAYRPHGPSAAPQMPSSPLNNGPAPFSAQLATVPSPGSQESGYVPIPGAYSAGSHGATAGYFGTGQTGNAGSLVTPPLLTSSGRPPTSGISGPGLPPRPPTGTAPPVPPRPAGSVAQDLLSSMPMNVALSAVERLSSQDRRKQLEKGVEGLANVGSKLFSKFSK